MEDDVHGVDGSAKVSAGFGEDKVLGGDVAVSATSWSAREPDR